MNSFNRFDSEFRRPRNYRRLIEEPEMRVHGDTMFATPMIDQFFSDHWSEPNSALQWPNLDSRRPRNVRNHHENIRQRLSNIHREFEGFHRLNEDFDHTPTENNESEVRYIPIQVVHEGRTVCNKLQTSPAPRYIQCEVMSEESDTNDDVIIVESDMNNSGVRNLHENVRRGNSTTSASRISHRHPGRVNSHANRIAAEHRASPPVLELTDSLTECFQPSTSRLSFAERELKREGTPYGTKTGDSIPAIQDTPGYLVYDYLKSRLESDQRQIDYIQGDGNCFFRALSKDIYGQEEFHLEIRQAVVDVIEKYPKKFEQYLDGESSLREHIKEMRLATTWASTMEIYAAATLLQRDVYVLSPNHTGEVYSWLLFSPRFGYDGNMSYHPCFITLCHTNGNHYDRIAAKGKKCNCDANPPKLSGSQCYVDLTNVDLAVC